MEIDDSPPGSPPSRAARPSRSTPAGSIVDVAIVGGGPAGSTCAAFCAAAGLRTLVLEREKFPREKVCGDCINPSCWPVLERLELAEQIRNWPHGLLNAVEFITIAGNKIR